MLFRSALASTRRVHILNLLRSSAAPLDVGQIAERSALHPNTVRFHLKVLVDAGLACCRTDRQGGTGRPRLLYAPAYGLVSDEQIEAYRAALGDRLRIVEVPGSHMVQWDAFDEVAAAVEQLLARASV